MPLLRWLLAYVQWLLDGRPKPTPPVPRRVVSGTVPKVRDGIVDWHPEKPVARNGVDHG